MAQDTASNKTVYITGADESYFLLALTLLGSFEKFCPDEKLYICDFDLNEAQCSFLDHKGILLPRPKQLAVGLHPYRNKSAIKQYLEGVDYDTVVWIDCDCLVVGGFSQAVERIIDSVPSDQPLIASSSDAEGYDIAEFIRRFAPEPFEKLLKENSTPLDSLYLNCGVFIMRSEAALDEWFKLSVDIPIHPLFEQNVFNMLAYRDFPQVNHLDVDVWNVHDLALNDLEVIRPQPTGPFSVQLKGKEVLVIHATSFQGRAVDFRPLQIPVDATHSIPGLFRFVNNKAVHVLFLEMISLFIVQNRELLIEYGVAS
jgi:hypothetical protein